MKHIFTFIFLSLFSLSIFSQNAKISGTVTDYKTKETLVGVNIILNNTKGVTTDEKGFYSIEVEPGEHQVDFMFIGYAVNKRKVKLKENEHLTINVRLEDELKILDEVVVSAGRFEQKLSDVTMSMEIIRAHMIENTNTQNIETVIQQVPGVMIMDDQASIRGGSSYSYGAGSRVLMLVDDMPMLAGASGDIKWNFAPVENIDQIEVIKGASSALYGSSALNGVINVRTKYPKMNPETKLIFSSGIYGNPQRPELKWWGNVQPIFTGTQFFHSRRFGNFDLVVGGNVYADNGYRQSDDEQRARINFNTRWRSKKFEGLTYGVNANYMKWDGSKFFIWESGDSGVYRANETYDHKFYNTRMNIDPYITYYTPSGYRHSLKTRLFNTTNNNSTNQASLDNTYFGEYQFQRQFNEEFTLTSGITGTYLESFAEIYGATKHYGASAAFYTQVDKKFNKLTTSLGGRWETFRLEKDLANSRPVFRAGLNYHLFDKTYLRSSFGQGFRYPTISEKYIRTSVSALNLFPNDSLQPEKGWSAELAVKHGFNISNWSAYIDVAGFWTEYQDMIEFAFGYHFPYEATFYPPDTVFKYIGFKAYNISNAQITGVDITLVGHGKLFGLPTSLMAGYTYTNPVDLNIQEEDKDLNTSRSRILKYRFYHSAKVDFDITWRDVNFGFSMNYTSAIVNIDKVFEDSIRFPNGAPIIFQGEPMFILPGLKEYREKYNTGQAIFDVRIGYDLSDKSRISVVGRNILNEEYMYRPGDVQAPRTYALQYMLKI